MHELIVPVGTSTLTGWMPRIDPALRLPASWPGVGRLADADAPLPDARAWLPRLRESREGGAMTCAELDSTKRWMARRGLDRVSRLTFVVSDTVSARWVGDIVEALTKDLAEQVHVRVAERLEVSNMPQGLPGLVRAVAELVKGARDRGASPAVNATPGFKAEAALSTLVGLVLGAEVFYLHEEMKDVVIIPAAPLRWDVSDDDIRALAAIEAESRDGARELLADRRHLWPFLERVTIDGQELWGRSALGNVLLASSYVKKASLPERTTPPALGFNASEGGHTTDGMRAAAQNLADGFSFVTRVQLYRWTNTCGRSHLVSETSEERDRRQLSVHVRLDQAPHPVYRLNTTARTDEELEAARRAVAAQFGYPGLDSVAGWDHDTASSTEAAEVQTLCDEGRLMASNAALASRVAELERALATATLRADALGTDLESARRRIAELGEELQAVGARYDRFRGQADAEEQAKLALQARVDAAHRVIEAAGAALSQDLSTRLITALGPESP